MPQKTNLNVSPYFDDYNASKNFYKVLFRPGYAVQTRELTTLQSILQSQIENYGKFNFKQGELVVPGEVGLNTKVNYVKLSSVSEVAISDGGNIVYKKYDIKTLVGLKLRGINSNVIANVIEAEYATSTDSDTLYVTYLTSGDSNNEVTFRQGETLEVVDGINTPLLVVGTDGSVLPTTVTITDPITSDTISLKSPAMGFASAVKVQEGIYFVNGYFVRNDAQLLIIDKYYDKPSAKIGFTIVEDIVTPEEDASLYDIARGSTNYSSPGAHRLKISLELKRFDYGAVTDKNFIQLLQIRSGSIESLIKPADYTLLEETLARRTYDESGDYVVNDFSLDIREYYQKNGNNGFYQYNTTTKLVNGISETEASQKMVLGVGPGKAYVKGFEIVNKETKYLTVNKARDTLTRDNVTLKSKGLSNFKITNVYGSVPLNTVGDELTAYPNVYLNSLYNDGTIGLNNTESSTYFKQTVDRRSKGFSLSDATKTIYVQIKGDLPSQESQWPTKLWFIKTRSGTQPSSVDYVDVIAHSLVNRPEVSSSSSQYFLELTVLGKKAFLDTYLKEYDDAGAGKYRYLYLTEATALAAGEDYYGWIVDYNLTITPVVGIAKPKDFSFNERAIGFNQDTDIILSKGRTGSGSTPYTSSFNFSYFNPVFFTRITVETVIDLGFTSGKYITGKTSKAFGVIENDSTENYSFGNTLFVSTLSGNFLPGETIFDEDGNSVKIATENTISHFVVNYGGNGYPDTSKLIIDGSTIDASNVAVNTYGGKVYKCTVLNRNALSQTYSSPPVVTVSPSPSISSNVATVTPVLYKNTVLTFNPQNIKSFYSQYNNYNYTADVDLTSTSYSSYYQISSFTFSGTQGYKYLECNGFGADLSKDLIQGDIIQFNDSNNNVVKTVVQYVTNPQGTKKSRIYLDYALQTNISNASVIRLRPNIENVSTSSLIYPTGSKQLKSLISDNADTKFKYYIRKDFTTDLSSSGGTITFSAQLPVGTQRFVIPSEANYILTVLDKGSSTLVENGDIVYIDFNDSTKVQIIQSTSTNNQITAGSFVINLPTNYFGSISNGGTYPKLKLTATVEVNNAKSRLKTSIQNKRIIIVSSGDKVIPLRGKDYDANTIEVFSYSDVYKLRYVYEGTSTDPAKVDSNGNLISGTDITYKFTFDDGQRDTFYDVSRLVLKPGFDAPSGQLVVAFDYFEHSQGDFCTVDSYLHEAGITAEEIPTFNSAVHGVVSLKDVIDFRPKVDSNTTVTGFQDVSILSNPSNYDYINFVGSGGVVSLTPASDSNLEYTMSFSETQYLDRIDGVFLTKKGDFIIKEGNSSLNPSKPEAVDDAISLCYIHIPSFTNTSKDVRILPVDNKRYTMRDIGKLEKRIERLEYYTSLSILEQQALNMQVKDDIGMDRFKSGFIVDNFEAHKVGNLQSVDYKCAIDTQQSVLRPQSKEDCISLQEVNNREDQRIISGYVNNNGVVTLPFNEVKLLGNSNATKTINPNEFVVLQYVGDVSISPLVDQWYDTNTAPLVVDSNTQLNSIFLAKENVKESFSSLFNSFIINWVGTSKAFFNIESLANINSENIKSSVSSASVSSSSNISPQNNELAKGVGSKVVNNTKVSTGLQFFVRSIPVRFIVRRLKPNTKIYVFMEGRNINRWVVPDTKFTGIPENSLSTFNSPLVTDANGNLSGVILIPNGLAPVENTKWTGDVNTVSYDDSSEEIKFTCGAKTITFTSSSENSMTDDVDTFADVKFYSTGILPENPSSIVSTVPAYFKANEGVQLINNNTQSKIKPNPLAQTFKVENYEGGVFVTGIDLFFASKSSNIPIRVYISNIDSDKPGKYIIPGTESTVYPDTYLKVYLTGDVDTIKVKKSELVLGKTSNAQGPISKVYDKNNILVGDENSPEFELNKEQVYTLVLSNHNGKSFVANEALVIPSVTTYNATNNKSALISIAKDSGRVIDLKVASLGENYESASIVIESPQLPGGSTATGSVDVSNGSIYNATISLNGRGYTEAPSVVIKGIGTGSGGAVIESTIEIDTPAVRMGIAIDSGLQKESTTPTRFAFEYPVYLQNDVKYSLNIETDSIDYTLWASKLGEIEKATSAVVTSQPLLGSVYKSQNTDNWTEDLSEDIKFTMYRADFNTSKSGELLLTNMPLDYELLQKDPFETSVRSATNATSPLFKNNNYVVKINHRDHGFEDKGMSYVFYRNVEDVGGISAVLLNSSLFEVYNNGIDSYNIIGPNRAGLSTFGGGKKVLSTYNRKYEKLYAQIGYLQVKSTKIDSYVKTTNIVPVDSKTINYTSYSQSDYEKTFINDEHFFINQKVIASRINETMNSIDNSLIYKLMLSSTSSNLSPVIDLRTSSVKTISNRVENSTGQEDRFGKRNQILSFLPIYNLSISVLGPAGSIEANQSFVGNASKAEATVISVTGSIAQVKLKTNTGFIKNETVSVKQTDGTTLSSVTVTITDINELSFSFDENSNIVSYFPQNATISYDNKINGKVLSWDSKNKELIVENSYAPINLDYNSKITLNSPFTRLENTSDQIPDIFRVGDVIKSSDGKYVEVDQMTFTNGVDYITETSSKNSSALAKYVTKEISINSPGTSIDVRTTANIKDVENIKILYKIKLSSSQSNFDDIDWKYFNADGSPDNRDLAKPANSISGQFEKQDYYQELKYSVANLPEFTSFAIKIVMKTNDPVYVPKIQDIRAVASY
jgi:hypothetical protein